MIIQTSDWAETPAACRYNNNYQDGSGARQALLKLGKTAFDDGFNRSPPDVMIDELQEATHS